MGHEIKKILLVIGYSKEFGGGQKVFLTYVKEFKDRGYEVIAVLPEGPLIDLIKPLNVKSYVIDYSSIKSLITIFDILNKEKVDIVNTHLPKCSLIFSFVNLFYRIPICCTFHNAIIHKNLGRIKKFVYPYFYSFLSKMCNGIIINSEHSKKHFEVIAGINEKFMQVIYFGIELDNYDNVSVPKVRSDKFIIGTVGRLSPEKGHYYLIEALTLLQGIDYKCLIVGDGPLRKELEEQVKQNKIQDKIVFMGFQSRVAPIMHQMDAVVVPSLNETFGITIVEAFALKKMVIASNVGGIPELVKHKTTGLLVTVQDSHALAAAIEYSYNHVSETEIIGNNAYNFAKANFTSGIMAEKTLSYYDMIIRMKKPNHNQ